MQAAVIDWFRAHGRDLPWRGDPTPWGVLVCEVMSQQTPVARVQPAWLEWLARWPNPAALAGATPGDVVRAWGRLGYPRRALRLRECAIALVERHGGKVPHTYDDLVALPGIGDYTASAILAFAFGEPSVVLDTNIRRVLARWLAGTQFPAPSPTGAERRLAASAVPAGDEAAWNAAVMELGALICTATSPSCERCPLANECAWRAAGYPADTRPRRTQPFAGTDRQVRGIVLAALRAAPSGLARADVDLLWPDPVQRTRALASLLADGLAREQADRIVL